MIIVQVFIGTKNFPGALRHRTKWQRRKNAKRRFHAVRRYNRTHARSTAQRRTFRIASSHVPACAYKVAAHAGKNPCKNTLARMEQVAYSPFV
ncbi:hypothetical protein [Dyella japonica]|uniref:Uncharacterized protein n=1 Tax=Dyella japonica TaxID=231455 RepID=A0ABV2JXM3_9GAMM